MDGCGRGSNVSFGHERDLRGRSEDRRRGRVVAVIKRESCGRIEWVRLLTTAEAQPRRCFAAGQPILEHESD